MVVIYTSRGQANGLRGDELAERVARDQAERRGVTIEEIRLARMDTEERVARVRLPVVTFITRRLSWETPKMPANGNG